MLLLVLTVSAIVYMIIKLREAQLRMRNQHLERMVTERTSEIRKQKDAIEQKNAELETQREEILQQRDAIEEKNLALEQQKNEILSQRDELEVQKNIATQQRDEIAHHQKEIMDSIYYAKRIQTALLPISTNIAKVLPEHFILFKPRDIVSGDFYYFKHLNHYAKMFTSKFGVNYQSYNEIINSYSESTEGMSNYRDLDEIMESGKLIVGLRDREMVYHSNGIKQFNHYLAGEFAKYLGLDFEIKIIPNLSDYFTDSNGNLVRDSSYTPEWFNTIDVACDLLAPIDWRLKKIDIVDVLPTANVVVARKNLDIKNINDLHHLRGVTSKGSVYEEALIDNDITNYYCKEANLQKPVQFL